MKNPAAVALFVFGVAAMTASTVTAQSLADVAGREAARRSTVKAHGKVYTNDSLRSEPGDAGAQASTAQPNPQTAPPSAEATPSSGEATAAASDEKAAPSADQTKKGEAYWKGRMQAERDGLTRAQTLVDALQSRINALSADFTARDDPAQRDGIAADRQKALAELARMKQEIQQHTKAITAIREEARRAGAPAGWVR